VGLHQDGFHSAKNGFRFRKQHNLNTMKLKLRSSITTEGRRWPEAELRGQPDERRQIETIIALQFFTQFVPLSYASACFSRTSIIERKAVMPPNSTPLPLMMALLRT
jgi:hypothetical protein